mmetsp:Transcript_27516/g.48636  ORF Transcript_27516/g.48636 Transcript_27516/m.48636 type:complete len:227 (-) Transcript_27516:407-1087(-)
MNIRPPLSPRMHDVPEALHRPQFMERVVVGHRIQNHRHRSGFFVFLKTSSGFDLIVVDDSVVGLLGVRVGDDELDDSLLRHRRDWNRVHFELRRRDDGDVRRSIVVCLLLVGFGLEMELRQHLVNDSLGVRLVAIAMNQPYHGHVAQRGLLEVGEVCMLDYVHVLQALLVAVVRLFQNLVEQALRILGGRGGLFIGEHGHGRPSRLLEAFRAVGARRSHNRIGYEM